MLSRVLQSLEGIALGSLLPFLSFVSLKNDAILEQGMDLAICAFGFLTVPPVFMMSRLKLCYFAAIAGFAAVFSFPTEMMINVFLFFAIALFLQVVQDSFSDCETSAGSFFLAIAVRSFWDQLQYSIESSWNIDEVSDTVAIFTVLISLAVFLPLVPLFHGAPIKPIYSISITVLYVASCAILPAVYAINFVLRSQARIYLLLSWGTLFAISIGIVGVWGRRMPKPVTRKLFHVAAAITFGLGAVVDARMTRLIAACALCAYCTVELVRMGNIPYFSALFYRFMLPLADSRDGGDLVTSHLHLLLACAGPVWLTALDHRTISVGLFAMKASGAIATGIGDAVAAAVGIHFGRHKWIGSNRTVEGTLAGWIASSIATFLFGATWTQAIVASGAAMLLEAFTRQNDNTFVALLLFTTISALL